MARASANKLYRTFVKGLVTEASPLTYPEDTSYDERNTILSRKGSRTRRLGINYLSNTLIPALRIEDASHTNGEYVWTAPGNDPDVNFLVVQKGLRVRFMDMSTNVAGDTLKPFSINLGSYLAPGWNTTSAAQQSYQMSSGKGYLFIVGRAISPIVVQWNKATNQFSVTKLLVLIRDFDGLNDGLSNDEEPVSLTKEHHYNLLNQGWLYGRAGSSTFSPVAYPGYVLNPDAKQYVPRDAFALRENYSIATPTNSPIEKFKSATGRYPGNNKQWWVARAEADDEDRGVKAGDFLPEVLDNLFSGNNRAPNGHFIIDAFNKNRSQVSGISDIPTETNPNRPEAVAFFSGRAWYGEGSTVYFSQIIDSTGIYKAGLCYQEADPTAEDISDLIPSDGGVVPIPEADRIRKLMPLGNGVIVMAENGVWFISGGDSAFSAVNISVSKVSSLGTKAPMAAIEVDETIFWWNEVGIQAMQQASGQFGPVPGKFGNTNISEQTIQSLFNAIEENKKQKVKAAYDPRNNRVMWIFNDAFEEDCFYNKCLLFDLTLQAFFLWEFGEIEDGPRVTSIYNNTGLSVASSQGQVIDELGNVVTTIDGDPVLFQEATDVYAPSNIQFLVDVPGTAQAVAIVSDSSYMDWTSFDGTGVEYDSYVETGFEMMGDAMREKSALYVFCHFRREENSSCEFTTKWEWSNSRMSNRWTTTVEAYRERVRPLSPNADREAFDVVTTKNKVRGSGKAVQFRFGTSQRGKNFELLGWSVAFVGNTQP